MISLGTYAFDGIPCQLKSKDEVHKMNCLEAKVEGYLSDQSMVKNPTYSLKLEIPLESGGFFNAEFDYKVETDTNCESLKCFNELDLWQTLIKEDPTIVEQLQRLSTKKFDGEKLKTLQPKSTVLIQAKIHPHTPYYTKPPKFVMTKEDDIYSDDLMGILSPGDNNEVAMTYLPPDKKYTYHFLKDNPEKEVFEWDPNAFDDFPDGEEPDGGDTINDLTNAVSPIVATAGLTIEPEELDNPQDDAERFKDSDDPESENLEGKSYVLKFGDKEFTVTPFSEEGEETIFTISNGTKVQKFRSENYYLLKESEQIYQSIDIRNNEIYLKLDEDFEEPLGVVALTEELNVQEDNKKELTESDSSELTASKCVNSLKQYIQIEANDENVKEFLKIQGKLTLHRLAWAQLQFSNPKKKLEQNILKLIKEKYSNENAEIATEFDKINPRSRSFLAKAMSKPGIRELLNKQSTITDKEKHPYLVNLSDVKMLEILSSFEELEGSSLDHRQFTDTKAKNNISNFGTLINSAYLHSNFKLLDNTNIENNKNLLFNQLPKYEADLNDILKDIIFSACLEPLGISCRESYELVDQFLEEDFDLMITGLFNSINQRNDANLLRDLEYSKIWLNVSR